MAQLRTTEARKQIKLILLGKTGHGKSATGNSILGRKEFKSHAASRTITKEVKNAFAEIGQYDVNVVDGPGLEDTDLKQGEQAKICCSNMAKALAMCNGGVHAFLFVLKLTFRFNMEEKKAISDVKKIYGDNCLKEHGIVVITEGDMFEQYVEAEGRPDTTFEQWWKEQDEDLFKECTPRIVLFNNYSKDEHEKEKQRNLLMQHVIKLADKKGLYTNEHFKKFEEIRAKMIKEENLPIFSKDMQKKLGTTEARKQINLILLGKTGHGKSATGNSILGRPEFESRTAFKSITKEVKNAFAEIGQYDVNVVDGPGLEDTDLKQEEQVKTCCSNMAKALAMCNGGVHAFLFVIKLTTRLTREERKAISDLKNIYGDNYLKVHGIVVITEGDKFKDNMEVEKTPDKTFEQWWKEQDEDLFKECTPRIVLFTNYSKDEQEKEKQRNLLMQHVIKLADKKGLYTNEHFKKYGEIRAKMIKEENLPIFNEGMQKKINILSGTLLDLPDYPHLSKVESLNKQTDELEKQILGYGGHYKTLSNLKYMLVVLRKRTQALAKGIKEENTTKIQGNVSALRKLHDDLEAARDSPWKDLALRVCAFLGGVASSTAGAAISALAGPFYESLSVVLTNLGASLLEFSFTGEMNWRKHVDQVGGAIAPRV